MPRLVKGGKYVYGMSGIGPTGTIVIPPEAVQEYEYNEGDSVILMSGSCTSGGFGLTQKRLLEKSELNVLAKQLPGLMAFRIPEAEPVEHRGRLFCWTVIKDGGRFDIPLATLAAYGLKPGDLLAVGKGSYLAIAFIARGSIFDEALKHPELEIFKER
jgi:bifunctional DNA-binding transcriptional regulator/antitoxin component of YhaV-PrlF toxin-antitoxin module